jgi:two-component system, NarL family, nitrate/nitrite response regulator NarL
VRQPQAGAIQPVQDPAQVKGSVLLGGECCVATGDSSCEAYTAIASAVVLSRRNLIVKAVKVVVMLLTLALSVPALAQDSLGQNKQQVNSLTSRERQIVLMVAEGLTNKDVGRRLNLSEGTVKVHLNNIYTKLWINKRTALVPIAHAHREELMGPPR